MDKYIERFTNFYSNNEKNECSNRSTGRKQIDLIKSQVSEKISGSFTFPSDDIFIRFGRNINIDSVVPNELPTPRRCSSSSVQREKEDKYLYHYKLKQILNLNSCKFQLCIKRELILFQTTK